MRLAGTFENGDSEDEDSALRSSEDEVDIDETHWVRELALTSSVYDDAMLSPLVNSNHHCAKSWVLLLLNFFLQFMVLTRVANMVSAGFAGTDEAIFGNDGQCDLAPAEEMRE